jgi:hypothetical protein
MKTDPAIQESIEKLREVFGHPGIDEERRKIEQKLQEAHYTPGSVRVWADCLLATLLAARSQGFSAQDVFDDLARLAQDVAKKQWKKMPDGTYRAM